MAGAYSPLTKSILISQLPGSKLEGATKLQCFKDRLTLNVRSQALGPNIQRPGQNGDPAPDPIKVLIRRKSLDRHHKSQACAAAMDVETSISDLAVAEFRMGMIANQVDAEFALANEISRWKREAAIEEDLAMEGDKLIEEEDMTMVQELLELNFKSPDASPRKCRPHPYSHLHVGERWKEIQGSQNWDGLMDPIDPVLRGEMLRYGELAQATYDAFDSDKHSRYCGSCKFNKKRLLQKVGLDNRGYEITDYLYGTCDNPMAGFFKRNDAAISHNRGVLGGGDAEGDVWDKESNWMGFVAVVTDPEEIARLGRRDIVVVWRGTVTKLEWLENLRDYLAPSGLDERSAGQRSDLKIEAGFLTVYKSKNERSPYTKKSARQQVLEAVKRLVKKYTDEDELSITITGHSLGSALAKITAYDIAESHINHRTKVHHRNHRVPENWGEASLQGYCSEDDGEDTVEEEDIPITVYSYGGPRVGNDAFRDRVEELGIRVLRVVNQNDKVTQCPGVVVNESWQFLEKNLKPVWNWLETLPWTYTHIGVEFQINNLDSPYLRKTKDPWNAHNLEAYLHLLNGFHGTGLPFSPVLPRPIALVNKGTDLLTPNHYIPPAWWQEENKGLVRTSSGRWVLRNRDPEDYPEYDLDEKDPEQ